MSSYSGTADQFNRLFDAQRQEVITKTPVPPELVAEVTRPFGLGHLPPPASPRIPETGIYSRKDR